MKHLEILARAIEIAGGQNEAARALGVSQPTISQWVRRGLPKSEYLPHWHPARTHHATQLSAMTGGLYSRDQLLGLAEPMTTEDPA